MRTAPATTQEWYERHCAERDADLRVWVEGGMLLVKHQEQPAKALTHLMDLRFITASGRLTLSWLPEEEGDDG